MVTQDSGMIWRNTEDGLEIKNSVKKCACLEKGRTMGNFNKKIKRSQIKNNGLLSKVFYNGTEHEKILFTLKFFARRDVPKTEKKNG